MHRARWAGAREKPLATRGVWLGLALACACSGTKVAEEGPSSGGTGGVAGTPGAAGAAAAGEGGSVGAHVGAAGAAGTDGCVGGGGCTPDSVGGSPDNVAGEPDNIGGSPDNIGGSPDNVGGAPDNVGGSPEDPGPLDPGLVEEARALCNEPEDDPATLPTPQYLATQMRGSWIHCKGPQVFGKDEAVGIEFFGDGKFGFLLMDDSLGVVAGRGFDYRGTWEVTDNGDPLTSYQVNMNMPGGGNYVWPSISLKPHKMRLSWMNGNSDYAFISNDGG